ncbi:hypothetical protein DSLASN_12750 [Desulfoluna limicola]|uniref:DUF3786 domain-containing protein n=1 Tax=Desulfoluna limicola TaxID=2810562 RepID=A0ABM7PEZ1_9BACT|nr:DUF3786 domain-containing protein [Desulfoluna limicola]BCS95643.1 hypothetical protein DSLASN_12750 [Desulfoluna limicola]
MIHPEDALFDEKAGGLLTKLKGVDLASRANALGGTWAGESLTLSLFGRPHRITREVIRDHEGNPATPAVTVLLCRYILSRPSELPPASPEWVTLRDIKGAGVLTSVFTDNTRKIIETAFTGHPDSLAAASATLGGGVESHRGYDLSIRFLALPRIPVLIHFNDAEVGMPAQCAILFDRSAQDCLDLECLSIIVTYLAGNLIG